MDNILNFKEKKKEIEIEKLKKKAQKASGEKSAVAIVKSFFPKSMSVAEKKKIVTKIKKHLKDQSISYRVTMDGFSDKTFNKQYVIFIESIRTCFGLFEKRKEDENLNGWMVKWLAFDDSMSDDDYISRVLCAIEGALKHGTRETQ
jgi:hypothetical protein